MSRASKTTGIDIAVAMEILTLRQQTAPRNETAAIYYDAGDATAILVDNSTTAEDKCPCTRHSHANDMPLAGGQVLDLFGVNPPTADANPSTNNSKAAAATAQEHLALDRLKAEVSSMSLTERIQVVLKAQEDRVATYRLFDQGLRDVLTTGNITMYPTLCAQVTAIFSVLSKTINAVRDETDPLNKKLKPLLVQLQNQESQKLNFTAALHMDQMREASLMAAAAEGTIKDAATLEMLQSGIGSLRKKISKCVDDINQVLEELQCLLIEEDGAGE